MPVCIDVIILSYAKDERLKAITAQAVKTLLLSENSTQVQFNVLVIESNKLISPFQFEGTTTIYPQEPFGFNRYLNIGINHTEGDFIALCNNDLVFHTGWASEILTTMDRYPDILSANPYDPGFSYSNTIKNGPDILSTNNYPNLSGVLTGWCVFVKRKIFETIGPLDERFEFWYADNDYEQTLKKHKIVHALIKTSIVEHITAQSHDTLTDRKNLTEGQRHIFEKKWHREFYLKRFLYKLLRR